MNIEIIDFYKVKEDEAKKTWEGTCHAYLIDYRMDVRGIRIKKQKNYIYVQMPAASAIDQDTREKVWYPVINFIEPETNKALKSAIKEAAKIYFKLKKLELGEKEEEKSTVPGTRVVLHLDNRSEILFNQRKEEGDKVSPT